MRARTRTEQETMTQLNVSSTRRQPENRSTNLDLPSLNGKERAGIGIRVLEP